MIGQPYRSHSNYLGILVVTKKYITILKPVRKTKKNHLLNFIYLFHDFQIIGFLRRSHIFGKHVADYMKSLQEDDDESFKRQFSKYIKLGVDASEVTIPPGPLLSKAISTWSKQYDSPLNNSD